MPITAAAPPQRVPVFSGFDYVTVDAQRRRVYAAHGGSRALLVVDADAGTIVGQVRVGPMRGVAVDPSSGHVFTGNGDDGTISEVDPATLKVVRSSEDLKGSIDAIAYDAALGRIYADEDNGTKLWILDAKTMKLLTTVTLPGHKPEYLAVDPKTHAVYQNIDDLAEVAVIDGPAGKVTREIKTTGLTHNHPLQFDPGLNQIATMGTNGMLDVISPDGTIRYSVQGPARVDQCDLDAASHRMACAGNGQVTLIQLAANAAPKIVGTFAVDPGVHTLAIDPKTGTIWIVWGMRDGSGDFVQRLSYTP